MNENYNGWTNYPTWAVYTEITDNEEKYFYWREVGKQKSLYELADQMKEEIYESLHESEFDGYFKDLLEFALECVNWVEVANGLKDVC